MRILSFGDQSQTSKDLLILGTSRNFSLPGVKILNATDQFAEFPLLQIQSQTSQHLLIWGTSRNSFLPAGILSSTDQFEQFPLLQIQSQTSQDSLVLRTFRNSSLRDGILTSTDQFAQFPLLQNLSGSVNFGKSFSSALLVLPPWVGKGRIRQTPNLGC